MAEAFKQKRIIMAYIALFILGLAAGLFVGQKWLPTSETNYEYSIRKLKNKIKQVKGSENSANIEPKDFLNDKRDSKSDKKEKNSSGPPRSR